MAHRLKAGRSRHFKLGLPALATVFQQPLSKHDSSRGPAPGKTQAGGQSDHEE